MAGPGLTCSLLAGVVVLACSGDPSTDLGRSAHGGSSGQAGNVSSGAAGVGGQSGSPGTGGSSSGAGGLAGTSPGTGGSNDAGAGTGGNPSGGGVGGTAGGAAGSSSGTGGTGGVRECVDNGPPGNYGSCTGVQPYLCDGNTVHGYRIDDLEFEPCWTLVSLALSLAAAPAAFFLALR